MSSSEDMLGKVKSSMDSWFMMSNSLPSISLTMVYLVFVTVLGPNLMKNRKPLDLTNTLLVYNAAQVIFSSWWLYKLLSNWTAVGYIAKSIFYPSIFKVDEQIENQIDECVYYYLLSKYVELLDTVFFVLRQKWSQMTFLHVYHHANMAVTTWFYLKYIWGRHIVILAIINVFIHVLMYSYYLLSSLGPAIRPYLWWKPYLTQMQLGQFLLVLAYVGTLAYNGCEAQTTFIYFSAFNVTSFLLLFINFYRKAYGTKASSNSIHRTKAQ